MDSALNMAVLRHENGQDLLSERDDNNLFEAVQQVLQTGSLMPVIKEELKYSILVRREKEGKTELKPEISKPVSYELRPEEIQKQEKRREQNRIAAQRCRQRKKNKLQALTEEFNYLLNKNEILEQEILKLDKDKQTLQSLLASHLQHCPVANAYYSFENFIY